MIENFRFHNLVSTLSIIREKHPVLGTALEVVPGSLVNEVREKLHSWAHEEVAAKAAELSQSELKACFTLLRDDSDEEIVDKSLVVLISRPKKLFLTKSWRPLFIKYPHPNMERFVRLLWKKFTPQTENEIGDTAPSWVGQWLKQDTLVSGVFSYYQQLNNGRTFDDYLTASKIKDTDGLAYTSWVRLLGYGTSEDLQLQSSATLLKVLKSVRKSKDRIRVAQNYLIKINSSQWIEDVLMYIQETHGNPSDYSTREIGFWKGLPENIIDEFNKWFIVREIEKFFGGDERSAFWKQFGVDGQVKNLKSILGRRGFMLDFGKFGVIEFKEFGNAAYVYPAEAFRDYWERDRTSTSAYKNRSKAITQYRDWDGRIIHSGEWERKTNNILQFLIKNL